ncbi:PREDICTED: retinol dehydrogenase 13-like [Priapulus caudatus]|uniref:Retinol dehydrogenase 13-like n=1 Tax=Priapulus caudatus TaxID=37621 RepID=A0ABM1E733_PRICU|nr:PREDICTED: retinol dehydrogenase 13-like [Priapulus caudatus]
MAPKCSSTARIDGKTIVITGSNTGIGKETGKELARRGARIIIACRNVEKGEEAKKEIQQETNNENIEVMKLDLASLKSVKEFSTQLLEKESKIHILINNAGIMMVDKAKTEDNFELQIGTNHLGPVLLTMLLLDRMKESAPARIINVSSKFHAWGSIKWDDFNSEKSYSKKHEYAQSKLANILFARELSKRIEGTGVTVNSLHPGVVDTEIGRSLPLINNSIVRALTAPLRWAIMLTPEQGAQTSIYCAVAEELEGVTGEYFR